MILTYQNKINKFVISFIFCLLFAPQMSFAMGLSLSVSPTLFEMSAVPNQSWQSSIKVINTNPQVLTVYAKVVNFAPQGENGQGKFIPVFEEFTEGKTLAEWITVSDEAYTIPSEGSINIPIQVHIPEDASPGGHFAAILIGTKPPESEATIKVQTAQVVTSLFFVRIAGDVIENGQIRTFKAVDSFVDIPEVDFEVRFENKGNVHLQPQGEIVITNMWGKERGIVPINRQTHFGNVLPESIRKFNFTWKGESSFADIGRYTADLTLAYGSDSRKFVDRTTHFWVVPIKAVLTVLGSLLAILLLLSWSIKAYIRRMLAMSGVQGYVPYSQRKKKTSDVIIEKTNTITAPVLKGVTDLKTQLKDSGAIDEFIKRFFAFVFLYKKFFFVLLLLILSGIIIWSFMGEVTTEQRDYEITFDNFDSSVTVSSEKIIYDRSTDTTVTDMVATSTEENDQQQKYELVLTNSSDHIGMAADMQHRLEQEGYNITALKSDFGKTKKRTVIVYDKPLQESALALSKILGDALLSAQPTNTENSKGTISIFIGNDYFESLED